MALLWRSPDIATVGNMDTSISPYLKAWIKQGDKCVVGLIGEGSALELQANWDSPFEQDNPGSMFEKTGGVLQVVTGTTSKTTLNSAQVWGGNRPLTINLVINLYALSDPSSEVEAPIQLLKEFSSPNVNNNFPISISEQGGAKIGRPPGTVSVNIGRNFIYNKCIIESVSEPFDVTKDKNGHRLRSTLNIAIQTDRMINGPDLPNLTS